MDDMNTRRSTVDNVIPLPYIVGDHIDDEQAREQFREQFKDIWNRIAESEGAIEASLEQTDEEQAPLLVEGSITVRHEQQEPLSVDIRYKGYVEILCDEQKLSDIYSNLGCGVIDGYEFSVNEYLILKNLDSTVADVRKWNGEEFIEVNHATCRLWLGDQGKTPVSRWTRCRDVHLTRFRRTKLPFYTAKQVAARRTSRWRTFCLGWKAENTTSCMSFIRMSRCATLKRSDLRRETISTRC